MIIYVVTAYRYGDTEKHSYVVGAYDTPKDANTQARIEEAYRGGKYECGIAQMTLNELSSYDEDELLF